MKNSTENKNLVYISVDKLHPHPDNPRKELGDLTELSDSIKVKGIMQNLTVVPNMIVGAIVNHTWQDGYKVIIGHRRLAAAKLAGLKEVPCVIADMTEQEQIETMLLENMNRSDLTVYEQAKGMQMMLNFGESIETISEKTGFSKTTVKRRLEMAKLDDNTLKKVSERQLSLMDFDKLSEIKDIDTRNKVLETMGTNNFANSLKKAIDEEEKNERVAEITSILIPAGIFELQKEEEPSFYGMGKWVTSAASAKCLIKDLEEDKSNYRYKLSYGTVYIYERRSEAELEEKKQAESERLLRKNLLSEAFERAFALRKEFIANYSDASAKSHFSDIVEFIILRWWKPNLYGQYNKEIFAELLGVDVKGKEMSPDLVMKETTNFPEYALLCFAYAMWNDGKSQTYYDWEGAFHTNGVLDNIYSWLKKLGYEMSDEEIALQNGTSELYYQDDEEDEDEEN